MDKPTPDIELLKRLYPNNEDFLRLKTDSKFRKSEMTKIKTMYEFLVAVDDAMFAKESEDALARLIEANKTHRMI